MIAEFFIIGLMFGVGLTLYFEHKMLPKIYKKLKRKYEK